MGVVRDSKPRIKTPGRSGCDLLGFVLNLLPAPAQSSEQIVTFPSPSICKGAHAKIGLVTSPSDEFGNQSIIL
jgi:hypothetical protein